MAVYFCFILHITYIFRTVYKTWYKSDRKNIIRHFIAGAGALFACALPSLYSENTFIALTLNRVIFKKCFEYFGRTHSSKIRSRQCRNFLETIKSYIKYDFIAYVIVMYSVRLYNNVVIDNIFAGELGPIDGFEKFRGCKGRILCIVFFVFFFFVTNANFEGFTSKQTRIYVKNKGNPEGFAIHNRTLCI